MDLLTPDFGLFFWTLVAFLIVAFLLKKFAWKPILKSLNDREKNIADSIATADRVRAEMSQLKADNEILLAQAREERTQLLKEARDTKERIIAEAKEAAKAEAAKIMEETALQIENRKNAAIVDVKNQIGKLSLEVAEKILRKELSSTDAQSKYAHQLAEEITLN